jgi:hypothetical protein
MVDFFVQRTYVVRSRDGVANAIVSGLRRIACRSAIGLCREERGDKLKGQTNVHQY